MNKHTLSLTVLIMTALLSASIGGTLYAAPGEYEFDNPAKSGTLMVVSGEGDVTIEGYSGKTVLITTSTGEELKTPEKNEKAKGMKRIAGSGFSISKTAEDNAIVITRSMKNRTDIVVKVPVNTNILVGRPNNGNITGNGSLADIVSKSVQMAFNMKGGILDGNINISNVTGDIEAGTLDGDITITKVSGAVMTNTINGDITVTFDKYPVDTPMAFSTIDGDVDVTFPANLKAIITANTIDGDVFTDFDMEMVDNAMVKNTGKNKNKVKNTGAFDVMSMVGTKISGKIGGGGQDVHLRTIDGDIFIRKAK